MQVKAALSLGHCCSSDLSSERTSFEIKLLFGEGIQTHQNFRVIFSAVFGGLCSA